MRLEIIDWLKSGASLIEGSRLFALCTRDNHPFLVLLESNPELCYPFLIQELGRIAEVDPSKLIEAPKFRSNWPFLSDPDCPAELKILASDKISAYHRYCAAHAMLFHCGTKKEMQSVARDLMANYLENRAIIKEFRYYREHKTVLGKHLIFKWADEIRKLRKLNPIELVNLRIKLEHNIWRIQDQIKSKAQPHLRTSREQRLRFKQMQLAELQLIIRQYSS